MRSIRRTIVNSTDPGGVADGVWWRWQADVRPWEYYPTSISQAIEERYQALNRHSGGGAVPKLDLQVYSQKCPYLVDVVAQTQINKNTGFIRAISRDTARLYRKTSSSSLHAPSTAAQAIQAPSQATTQVAQLSAFRHQLQQPQQQVQVFFNNTGAENPEIWKKNIVFNLSKLEIAQLEPKSMVFFLPLEFFIVKMQNKQGAISKEGCVY